MECEVIFQIKFPSPQGGSETAEVVVPVPEWRLVSIPSRRVRDVTAWMDEVEAFVEFPSPQGGLETRLTPVGALTLSSFHPLKAGRRPRENEGKGGQKGAKGREGCRRPSVGGKS